MTESPAPPPEFDQGFDGVVGTEWQQIETGRIHARLPVRPALLQPMGLVHGGVYATVAETAASMGTFLAQSGEKFVAGMSNSTTFLRPITEGTISFDAVAIHRGRTTWVWDVTASDDAGRPCAISRVTIAVRERR